MNRNISVVMFDLGGVIVQLKDPDLFRDYLTGLCPGLEAWEAERFIGRMIQEINLGRTDLGFFFRELRNRFRLKYTYRDFRRNYDKLVLGPFTLPGLPAVLKDLQKHVRTAVLSNTCRTHMRYGRRTMRLGRYFHRIFESWRIGKDKPGPDIFRHALAKLRVRPGEVLFFDDMDENVKTAKELGINAVLAEHNVFPLKQLQEYFPELRA